MTVPHLEIFMSSVKSSGWACRKSYKSNRGHDSQVISGVYIRWKQWEFNLHRHINAILIRPSNGVPSDGLGVVPDKSHGCVYVATFAPNVSLLSAPVTFDVCIIRVNRVEIILIGGRGIDRLVMFVVFDGQRDGIKRPGGFYVQLRRLVANPVEIIYLMISNLGRDS